MFIENQRGEIKKYITESYTKYKQLSYELEESEIDRDLDDIIKGAIEGKVNSYSSKADKDSLTFSFIFVILCLTVISFFSRIIYDTLYRYDFFQHIIRIFSPISVTVYGLLLVVILLFVKRFKFTRIRILILKKKEIFIPRTCISPTAASSIKPWN
jgi:FlaA1/EpsC-like NDP-sugar epimerase